MSSSLLPTFSFVGKSDPEVGSLLRTHRLNLTIGEARKIETEILHRPPTLAELVLWSIQGSEHCSYKSSRPFLRRFVTDGPNVILGPKEDSGIIEIARDKTGRRWGAVLSHESHNHPSQVVPYEGAATGVGGNVRDVLCMGSEVVALLDGLCFGDPADARSRRIASGVVAGIAGYGNPLGIPNVGGFTVYDQAYRDNCLVTVFTAGIIPEDRLIHSHAPAGADDSYCFILVGKPTDISGFGGASFASAQLEESDRERNKGAVQEPNAFLERHLVKSSQALFEEFHREGLIDKVGFKDLGAGGIACASVELADAAGFGAEINVDLVPRGMPNLPPEVVLCSETQERFMWVVPPALEERVLRHYNETFALPKVSEGARAATVGHIRKDGLYRVTSGGQVLVEAPARLVTEGLLYDRPYIAHEFSEAAPGPTFSKPENLADHLLEFLASPAGRSRSDLYNSYDKQVQGAVILEAGTADAGVLAPFRNGDYPDEIRSTGLALTLDHNPRLNKLDPWWGAATNVLEAVRNIVAVGASPQCLTDCLCYGNPEKPDQMGEFVAGIDGIVAACDAIRLFDHPECPLPIISGNVSLYNESGRGSIPPSPIIGCVGSLADWRTALGSSARQAGNVLLQLGRSVHHLGGSAYADWRGNPGSSAPWPDLKLAAAEIAACAQAISTGHIKAAHDISEGGLFLALVEMLEDSHLGFKLNLPPGDNLLAELFSEPGGFLLETSADFAAQLLREWEAKGIPGRVVGSLNESAVLDLSPSLSLSLPSLREARSGILPKRL
jgi:phosphoribosylformylglycinamidine synthase II